MSDDMSRLQAENDMLRKVYRNGFGSLQEMDNTLSAFDFYFDTLKSNTDNGWSYPGDVARDIITKGIPLILAICKSMVKAQAQP
jgi:hypothetical protein